MSVLGGKPAAGGRMEEREMEKEKLREYCKGPDRYCGREEREDWEQFKR